MLEKVSQSFFSKICFYIDHVQTILCVRNCFMNLHIHMLSKIVSINKDSNLCASYVVAGQLLDR